MDRDGGLGISLTARLNQMKESDLYKKVLAEKIIAKRTKEEDGDDATQELTEVERGKDAENDEEKFRAEETKKSEKFAREAVMKRRINGPIS